MPGEGGRQGGLRRDAIRIEQGLPQIVPRSATGALEIGGGPQGLGQHVGDSPDPDVDEGGRHHRVKHGFIGAGPGADAPSHISDVASHLPRRTRLDRRKQQMLK